MKTKTMGQATLALQQADIDATESIEKAEMKAQVLPTIIAVVSLLGCIGLAGWVLVSKKKIT